MTFIWLSKLKSRARWRCLGSIFISLRIISNPWTVSTGQSCQLASLWHFFIRKNKLLHTRQLGQPVILFAIFNMVALFLAVNSDCFRQDRLANILPFEVQLHARILCRKTLTVPAGKSGTTCCLFLCQLKNVSEKTAEATFSFVLCLSTCSYCRKTPTVSGKTVGTTISFLPR